MTGKQRVLKTHRDHPQGLLDEELEALTENPESGKRRSELTKEGLIEDSGAKRLTRSGNMATVWRLSIQGGRKTDPLAPPVPVPEPELVPLKLIGLSRAEVDPDFKGSGLEFELAYPKVNLRTKEELAISSQRKAFSDWQAAVRACELPLKALLEATPDLQAPLKQFSEFLAKRDPAKREQWRKRLELFESAAIAVADALEVAKSKLNGD